MKYIHCKYCWKGFGKVSDKCPICRRTETELKEAIKKALKADLYYEGICEIVAKTINEVAEEKGNGKAC